MSPIGDEAPTVNGQAESSIDSVDREQELEPAEEVTENGPTGGRAQRRLNTCSSVSNYLVFR